MKKNTINVFKALVLSGLLAFTSCEQNNVTPNTSSPSQRGNSYVSYLSGDAADVQTTTSAGTVLMGGSTDVDEAIRWMISKSGGGDFVVIRASGADGYNPYIFSELGGVNSCETLIIDSRTKAGIAEIAQKIRNAEALFIAGGDQANYVNYWEGTPVEDAINYLINVKKVPVGGTSAGCAIMGQTYFSALSGTVTSAQMLANPYNRYATIGHNNFINAPFLSATITDTHYNNPDRKGRHLGFLARMTKDWNLPAKGIGVEERTAVLVEADGTARVVGSAKAYFLQRNGSNAPETCVSGSALTWNNAGQAVRVYEVQATATAATSATFSLSNWTSGNGGVWKWMSASNGVLTY